MRTMPTSNTRHQPINAERGHWKQNVNCLLHFEKGYPCVNQRGLEKISIINNRGMTRQRTEPSADDGATGQVAAS